MKKIKATAEQKKEIFRPIDELERTGKIKRAQIKVKDILWLIRGISEEVQKKAEQLECFRKISKEEYLNG